LKEPSYFLCDKIVIKDYVIAVIRINKEITLFPKVGKTNPDLRIPEGWFYVRLDGWNFRSLSMKLELEKPFDRLFAECLVETAKVFFETFNPNLAFLFSDEINLLFSRFTTFNRRLEKIDSVFAGLASSTLYGLLSRRYRNMLEVSFDCRVIPVKKDEALEYLFLRQMESYRNCYNAYAQHCLVRKEGLKPRRTADELRNVKLEDLKKLIEEHGITLSQIPKWHERGILMHWEHFSKEGFDPIRNRQVIAERRRVKVQWSPPKFNIQGGKKILRRFIQTKVNNIQ